MPELGTFTFTSLGPKEVDFVAVASEAELPNGKRLFVSVDEYNLVVFNIAGEYFAIADLCSHDNGPLGEGELEGHEIICPRHGARFDVRNGRVLSLPAVLDIPAYPTRVSEGMVEVGLPL
ncbi:MAG: non-heme iron oxygenase ferredoxin subunit [Anaerolineales bacterium]|jgi:3-phenylpropionate/trans-cinnamate dioxygenase ferredoxin subunit|nr:non-heme iron oxygenase ferredoxin subunit [Anaerolineales bacterium]MBX3004292.1 non-heme iron oxygenase ferredoxin subunit [Anaerolineales bacterium]